MKLMISWWWTTENAKEVTERFIKWTPSTNVKFLYPISTVIGGNEAFCVVEVDKIDDVARATRLFNDICTFEISPIMESREFVKMT